MNVDIHALSGAYAVDAVDEFERAQFERHISDCTSCRAEVDSLRTAASLIGETVARPAPDALRQTILASVQTVRPLPPVLVTAAERGRSSRRRFPTLVAAAAALIAVGGLGATVIDFADEPASSVQAELSATERVIQADDATRRTQDLPGGGAATVVRSVSLNQAVVVTEGLPAAPEYHAYELWLQKGERMIPAGQIAGGDNTVLLKGDAVAADGVGITVELAGEQPTVPSEDLVDVIGFEEA